MENERARFVVEAEISDFSHAELCRRYSISRPTGYKWLRRYQAEGLEVSETALIAPAPAPTLHPIRSLPPS